MTCASPLAWETLVAYWAGDLAPDEEAALEEHAMGCASCSAASARVAAITEALRAMIPPLVTRAELDRLRAKGLRVHEQTFAPGDRREGRFTPGLDLLVFRLAGIDLSRAASVGFTLRARPSGDVLVSLDAAPFDRDEGAVLLVCQRHFAALPPLVDAEVRVRDAAGDERVATYGIDHAFE